MRKVPLGIGLAVVVLLSLLATATAQGDPAAAGSAAMVRTAFNKTLKKTIVVDSRGRTLYMCTCDPSGAPSGCAGLGPECTKLWPAYTSAGAPQAGKGIKRALVATATWPGGKRQVVYNHHRLYYFAGGQGYGPGDKRPGDAKGQGILQVWYVLSPRGTPIK